MQGQTGELGEVGVSDAASHAHAIWGFTCEENPDPFLSPKAGKIGECVTLSPGHLTRASPVSQSVSAKTETTQSALVKGEAGESQQADSYHVSITYSVTHSPMLQLLCLSIVANQSGRKEDD